MTANELADWLDKKAIVSFTEYFGEHLELAADMLRQQEAALLAEQKHNEMLMAEIEALKKELALQRLSDISQEIEDRESAIHATGYWKGIEYKRMRELTDEEIIEISKTCDLNHILGLIDFARAILKKASEK